MSGELALVTGNDHEKGLADYRRPLKGEPAVALALSSGATIKSAAEAGGVSEKTVRRRLAIPLYRAEIRRLRSEKLERAAGAIIEATVAAVLTLEDLLSAASEHVRLGAVRTILEHAVALSEKTETRERITALEHVVLRQVEGAGLPEGRVPYGS